MCSQNCSTEEARFAVQVGILQASTSGNAPTSSECQAALKPVSCVSERAASEVPRCPDCALAVLWKLQHIMKLDEVPTELEFAPLTYLAGYLVFVCEKRVID